MLSISLNNTILSTFLSKFSDEKKKKVAIYLMTLGLDMAKKLGYAPGSNELFYTL